MKLYKLPLNKSLLLILLMISVIMFYSFSALSKFFEYKNKIQPNLKLSIDTFHLFLKNEIKKDINKLTATEVLPDDISNLPTFRFTVKQTDLNKLNSNLPQSGKEQYIDAFMSISNQKDETYKIKMRYRGDNNFHWLYPQKSLRIKLSKDSIYNMEKTFNLINPPYDYTFIDVINYNISSKFNLISPNFFPVRVFINGKYSGVFMYLSQVDESLLRKHKIMPGSIYFGDNGPANRNGVSSLWENANFWDKKAARNAEQKNIREDINLFITSIRDTDNANFYKFFNTMINKEAYYTFFALDTIFGSEHHDYLHNHKIYFDPYKGKFEPIQWDLRFWHPYKTKDVSLYPLIEKVSLNPILEFERDMYSYTLMNDKVFKYENIKNSVDKLVDLQLKDLMSDIHKDTAEYNYKVLHQWFSTPYDVNDLKKTIKNKLWHYKTRRSNLLKIYDSAKVKYKITSIDDENFLLEIVSLGNSPVEIRTKNNINISIFKDMNFNKKHDQNDTQVNNYVTVYPGRKKVKGTIENFNKLLSGDSHIIPSEEYYSFIVKSDKIINITDFSFTNKITGKLVIPIKESNIKANFMNDSIHPWKLPQPEHKTKTFSGVIRVKDTQSFDKYTNVNIEPGTTFIMDENTSVYFYGKVTAKGTKEQPIKFIAKDPKKPWGLVAVQGKATTGSKFEYVEFENGSVDTRNLIHYTSPFNIHDMDWFEVRHCKIGRNFVGDDSMHIAYAKGVVDSCEFHDARSDGLDIDISDVNVTNNIFYHSGNDGLDIMTTKMNASNNVFIDTGDKGISVGEWSDANITDSFFLRTVIGTEIKDKSKIKADNLIFADSKEKAINLYNKNKRYDTGGFLEANTIYVLGNKKIKADKKSNFNINNMVERLPDLNQYNWYKNLENTTYKNLVDRIEVKYAK